YNAGAGRYSSYQSLDSSNREPSENWVYAVPFKQYGWLVCSSVNENEVRMAYGENSGRLEIDLIMEIAFICILGLLVTCAAIIFSISVSRVMKNEIDLLVAYFRDCFKKEAVLSENQLRFNEFRFIGSAAVAMVTQIKELIRRVKDLAIKAEMNSQIKSAYLSTMSHQFRNPVNGVLGMTQLLADTNLTDEQKGYVKSIEISANSLTGLVEDIDDYADMGTGPLELDILPFEPRGIAEEVVLLLNRQAIDKKIKLELNVDQNVPKYLLGDSERLKQILTVLVRNAIYFTNEGGVRIETSSSAGGEKNTELTFKVVDTGIGISEGKLLAVFDFTHEEYSKSRKFAAVGLSLAVCRQLIEAMSGKISVESTKGKGSAFSFAVPLGIADGQKMADELKKKGDASASGTYSGVKVLVAEDDPINRSVALKLMAKLGITVETAVNGAEAFRKFSSSRYDIVFMDCEMPEVDGFTATGNIRKKEAEDKSGHVPVVAMTAYAMRGDREMCFEAGMDDHIAKPVTKELLIKILNKYVRKEG
ncbi:MAG: response regulator, partial [Victivallales bacterium]